MGQGTAPEAPGAIQGGIIMDETSLIELITAIGTVATPILILLLTAMGWMIRNRLEQIREREEYWRGLEEKLRDDRIDVYNTILDPFVVTLTKDEELAKEKSFRNKSKDQIIGEKMLTLGYKRASFKLVLMGSDNVVRAYNRLMQYFYSCAETMSNPSFDDTRELMHRIGDLLLEIRKSVGNENTALSNLEMLEWLLKDFHLYQEN